MKLFSLSQYTRGYFALKYVCYFATQNEKLVKWLLSLFFKVQWKLHRSTWFPGKQVWKYEFSANEKLSKRQIIFSKSKTFGKLNFFEETNFSEIKFISKHKLLCDLHLQQSCDIYCVIAFNPPLISHWVGHPEVIQGFFFSPH